MELLNLTKLINTMELPHNFIPELNARDAFKYEKISVTIEITPEEALDWDNRNLVFEKFWPAYCRAVLIEAHKRGLQSRAD